MGWDMETASTDLMKTDELAALWQLRPKTLDNWRSRRVGPPFVKINGGAVRYSRAAVDEWLAAQQDHSRIA